MITNVAFFAESPVLRQIACLLRAWVVAYPLLETPATTRTVFMNIHEYQAKALLRQYGPPVSDGRRGSARRKRPRPRGRDGRAALGRQGREIHAGGRGKGHFKEADAGEKGGVRLAKSVEEAADEAKEDAGPHARHASDRPRRGKRVNRHLASRMARASSANCLISPCSSTARPSASPSSARPKAAWTSRRSPPRPPKDPVLLRRSRHRLPGLPRSPRGLFAGPDRQAGQGLSWP